MGFTVIDTPLKSTSTSTRNFIKGRSNNTDIKIDRLNSEVLHLKETFKAEREAREKSKNLIITTVLTAAGIFITFLIAAVGLIFTILKSSFEYTQGVSTSYFQELVNLRREVFTLPKNQ